MPYYLMLMQIDKQSFFQSFVFFTVVMTTGCDIKVMLAISKHVHMKMNLYFVNGLYFKTFTIQLKLRAETKVSTRNNQFYIQLE